MNAQTPIPPNQSPVMQGTPGGAMPSGPGMHPGMMDEGGINITRIIDTLWEDRKFIAIIAAILTSIGLFYAVIAKPYFEATMTVQVEDSNNPGANVLDDLMGGSDLFSGKNQILAETEILRSRMVVKKAVDNLNIDIEVEPKRFPIVGDFIARRSSGLSTPGLLGVGGYCWGKETLDIRLFETEKNLIGQEFEFVVGLGGVYVVTMPDGVRLKGEVGKPQVWNTPAGRVKLLLRSMLGRPGATFSVLRRDRIEVALGLIKELATKETAKGSGVIRATLTGSDPKITAETLNAIGRQYILQNVQRKGEEAGSTLAFLDTQLPKLKAELDAAELDFNQFRQGSGTIDLGEEAKAALQQSVVAQQRVIELTQQRAQLTARLTPAHPSVVALDGQIAAARVQVEKLNTEIRGLPKVERDFLRLTREVQVKTQLYQQLLNSSQQLQIVRASKVGNVRMIDEALPPQIATKPKRKMIVVIAAMLGAGLGLALALVKIALRGGIEHADDIERLLGLTVYASVPLSPEQQKISSSLKGNSGRQLVLASQKENDPAIESLRSLRTALQFAMLDARNNIMMISGPTPGLGKSFVAANFAAVMAASGKRVLLIDGDIRKGYLNQYFGMDRRGGLTDVISGSLEPGEAIRHEVMPGLDFLPTGEMPPNPSEMLLHPRLRQMLDDLAVEYDQVIIDSPPVLVVSDATVLSTYVGSVFLVAREGLTTIGDLDDSTRRLQQSGANVKGVVFNGVRPRLSNYYGYGSRYGYKYGGGYGYSRYQYEAYTRE
jgi:tyrosine-protein kinase Etk/Wzc